MKKIKKLNNQLVVYQSKAGAIELKGDFRRETVWATQADIVRLYEKDQSVISRHIASIFKDKEIDSKSNMQKMHIANSDKPVVFYSLDIILAVGYRTNSKRAIEFRQWATKTLRQYIVDGFAINKNRIAKNYDVFEKALADVKALLPAGSVMDNESVLELIKLFSDTWLSLDAYDKDTLKIKGVTKKRVALTAERLRERLAELKIALMKKGEATEFFGAARQREAVAGIVGNVMQSFGGKELYASVEEKAAHLLYFMVKNHPFIDGNKRSGAYAFVWFLRMAKILDTTRITPPALTALTILVAESNPKDKEKMIRLVLTLLAKGR
jgi:prophage maintenance system killer protein